MLTVSSVYAQASASGPALLIASLRSFGCLSVCKRGDHHGICVLCSWGARECLRGEMGDGDGEGGNKRVVEGMSLCCGRPVLTHSRVYTLSSEKHGKAAKNTNQLLTSYFPAMKGSTAHDEVSGPSKGPGCHELDVAPAYGGQPFGLAQASWRGTSASRAIVRDVRQARAVEGWGRGARGGETWEHGMWTGLWAGKVSWSERGKSVRVTLTHSVHCSYKTSRR